MSLKETPSCRSEEQSAGCDPITNKSNTNPKRNSGLFSFFKWFKSSTSRESIDTSSSSTLDDSIKSSSCDSLNSIQSAGTVASFSFVPPNVYDARVTEKSITVGPETDTYRARLKQRDKRRENDKNVTLRKKYNLFFNRESLLFQRSSRRVSALVEEENTKSLPLMTHHTSTMDAEEENNKVHRRTNSESSKIQRAGAYLHVKGKRRAPQPPGADNTTTSLKRNKKRLAPAPPSKTIKEQEEATAEVLCNDSLKLDHGMLRPAKELALMKSPSENSIGISPRSSFYNIETPVSPRPWYKRNSRENVSHNNNHYKKIAEKENKYEPVLVERLPDVTLEDAIAGKKEDNNNKRKSGLAFLTNISELDREASEILKSNKESGLNLTDLRQNQIEIPQFMRPKEAVNMDSWVSPKRRSARDLIAKFNAITNVTKVTVFGGASHKDKFFGKQQSLDETRQRQEALLETHKKRIEEIDKKKEDKLFTPLMKSESASAVKKPETPKLERKSWRCPKCNLENEYWRIICHVCSAIKPYFDDFAPSTSSTSSKDNEVKVTKTASPLLLLRKEVAVEPNKAFERAKTQIGFSALASYNANKNKRLGKIVNNEEASSISNKGTESGDKNNERDKLKKMLIEMKNSLPKRKSNIMLKRSSRDRASIIVENPTEASNNYSDIKEDNSETEKSQEEKVAEILIGSTTTIYENIKMKKTDNPKPLKVSSSAQTSAVVKKTLPSSTFRSILQGNLDDDRTKNYEPMKLKDFEDIYSSDNKNSPARIYANLAQNDELSLFFNVPKNVSEVKNSNSKSSDCSNTDTIEINRLLRRLETAISKGELTEAAIFAKELAQMKVSCSVIRQKPQLGECSGGGGVFGGGSNSKGFQIEMYVEDKVSHRGPFPIEVTETQTVADLKEQIENEFDIPKNVQRWILGKELVTDDSATLKDHNIKEGCAVFLYLVAPDKTSGVSQPSTKRTSLTANLQKTQNNETSSSSSTTTSKNIQLSDQKLNSNQPKPTFNKKEKESTAILNEANKEETNTKNEHVKNTNLTTVTNKTSATTTKVIDHTPKIVNVIPKLLETNKQKTEIVRIIPVQLENKPKPEYVVSPSSSEKPVANQRAVVHDKPIVMLNNDNVNKSSSVVVSTTELKIETKQTNQYPVHAGSSSSSNAVVVTSPGNYSSSASFQLSSSTSVQSPSMNSKNGNVVPAVNKIEPSPSSSSTVRDFTITPTSITSFTTKDTKSTPSTSSTVLEIKKEPLLDTNKNRKDFNTKNQPSNSRTQQPSKEGHLRETTNVRPPKEGPPRARIEEDFLVEDYETKTIKPSNKDLLLVKEWECHLCTLLNPVSSNVCAVCATVRVNRLEKVTHAAAAAPRKSVKKKAPQPGAAGHKRVEDQTYLQLVNLDSADLVENVEAFECVVCFLEIPPRQGVTLRECLHQFCKACLAHTIEYTEEAETKCPYRDDDYSCDIALQDREIKALVAPAVYEQYLARSVTEAENKMDKSFHCKTPDCRGWCIFEDNVNEFRCPVCRNTNCLTCQAIHMGINCRQYQEKMHKESEIDEDAKRTRDMLDEMVDKGEALTCPTCKVVLMKKWGCDWLRCSMCKTEICWVTRGPRWGPAGKGDTSGGCQCGINGVKCHPKCNYCH